MNYTNKTNLPLSIAVWLAHDAYDHVKDPNYLSATDFNRPLKQLILSKRPLIIDGVESVSSADISSLIPSKIGTAIHDSIESAWKENRLAAFQALGMNNIAARVVVNPIEISPTTIPVYMELRKKKNFNNFIIGGKFDFVSEGTLEDFKSTKVYSYLSGSNDQSYIRQASIYRWLNPDIVTNDHFFINYIFTDWLPSRAKIDANYPQTQILQKKYTLLSIEETEQMMANVINNLTKYMHLPEESIPRCTDEELWRSNSVFKYYVNPSNLSRSTKNFDNLADAITFMATKNNVGTIVEQKGEVKRCNYCPAFEQCQQKNEYM